MPLQPPLVRKGRRQLSLPAPSSTAAGRAQNGRASLWSTAPRLRGHPPLPQGGGPPVPVRCRAEPRPPWAAGPPPLENAPPAAVAAMRPRRLWRAVASQRRRRRQRRLGGVPQPTPCRRLQRSSLVGEVAVAAAACQESEARLPSPRPAASAAAEARGDGGGGNERKGDGGDPPAHRGSTPTPADRLHL